MRCNPGMIQAYADDDLSTADLEVLKQHMVGCATCQSQLSAVRRRQAGVLARLGALDPPVDEIPDPSQALAVFRVEVLSNSKESASTLRRKAKMIKQTLFTGRWRPVSIGLTAVICLVALFSFAPVRRSAADFLGIFRVRKFAAIPVDPAQAQRLESLADSLDKGTFGKPTTVREAGEAQVMIDAAQASAFAGIQVRTPSVPPLGASLQSLTAQSGPALHFEMDRPTLQAFLNAAGVQGAALPDVEVIKVDVDVPVIVAQRYAAGNAKLTLMQVRSPEVALPDGLDPTALGELGLQVLGIPAADAERIAREIDWTSTVIVPFPTDIARSTEVTVDGSTGLLLEETRQNRSGRGSVLVWERDGIVYSIDGQNVDPSVLVQVGDSLQ
jgi:hypothetical protein